MVEHILGGLELATQPAAMAYLLFGVVTGFVVGVLPGFSSSTAATLVLPFSIGIPIEHALILIAAIYAGASFAGAVPAILMNVPGTPGAAATALDGYPMAKAGQAELAIGIARMASVAGGVLSVAITLVVIGPLSTLALQFGAREMFVVALLGLVVISTVIGDDIRKGLMAAVLGLLIASMAASPLTGQPRFTLGFLELYEDVPFIPSVIGLFALTEMFLLASRDRLLDSAAPTTVPGDSVAGSLRRSLSTVSQGILITLSYPAAIVRATVVGVVLGVIPGLGSGVANFISYGLARRWSATPERFGKGAHEGVIASEACDNAVTSASLVPTLTLGIPGSATMAVMLAALYLHGIQPGPRVMITHPAESYAVLLALLFASILILPVGVVLATPMTYVTRLRPAMLVPIVTLVSVVGAYAVRSSMFDAGLAVAFGVLGCIMRVTGYPVVPLVLGLILGPLAEENLLRALLLADGDPGYFFQSATALVLWGLLAITILSAVVRRRAARPA